MKAVLSRESNPFSFRHASFQEAVQETPISPERLHVYRR
jgi:hypothetical protein